MKKLLQLTIFFFAILSSFAQQNIATSGNDLESTTGKVTYSVGLIHYKEATGIGGSSSTGSQISFEVLESLNLDDENLVSMQVYPNPTSDFITINLIKLESLNYKLVDISGREISNGKLTELQTKINLSQLDTSIYLLTIYKNNSTFKSYKIIKN